MFDRAGEEDKNRTLGENLGMETFPGSSLDLVRIARFRDTRYDDKGHRCMYPEFLPRRGDSRIFLGALNAAGQLGVYPENTSTEEILDAEDASGDNHLLLMPSEEGQAPCILVWRYQVLAELEDSSGLTAKPGKVA